MEYWSTVGHENYTNVNNDDEDNDDSNYGYNWKDKGEFNIQLQISIDLKIFKKGQIFSANAQLVVGLKKTIDFRFIVFIKKTLPLRYLKLSIYKIICL